MGADDVDGMAVRSGFRSDGAWEGGNECQFPYKTVRLFTSCATVGGSRVGLKWLLELQQMILREDLCFLRVVVIHPSNRICTAGRTSSIFELPTNSRHCVIQKLASAVYTESITTNIYLCRRCGVRHAACSRPTTGWIATRTSTPCMRCSSENGSSTSCSLRLTETYIRT